MTEVPARRRARDFGLRAEWLALALMTLKGYRILDRRYHVNGGEIDLVARRGTTIAFVEVKGRPNLDEALGAISEKKRRRISRAARVWLTRNPSAMGFTLRGDAVFVAPGRWPKHVVAAFELTID